MEKKKKSTKPVIRQGTFDTDPTEALGAREGTKQGAIELPVIDDQSGRHKGTSDSKTSKTLDNSLKTLRSPSGTFGDYNRQGTFNQNAQKNLGAVEATPSFVRAERSKPRVSRQHAWEPKSQDTDSKPRPGTFDRKMDPNNIESFESVYAERQGLLEAEVTYKKRIKQLEDEVNAFLKTVQTLSAENKELRIRIEELEGRDPNDRKSQAGSRVSLSDIEGGSSSELKEHVVTLQTDNQKLSEENIKLKAENLENVKKIHELEKDKLSLESNITTVETAKLSDFENIKSENEKLLHEKANWQKLNDDLEAKVKSLESENKDISEALSQKRTELDELLTAMKGENSVDNQLKQMTDENVRVKKELSEASQKLEETAKLLDETKIDLDRTESEKTQLNLEAESLKQTTESQSAEIEELKSQIEQLKKELEEERSKNDHLKSADAELTEVKEQLAKLQEELEKSTSDKDVEILELKETLETVQSASEKEIIDLKLEMEAIKTENEKMKKKEETRSISLEDEFEEFRLEIEKQQQRNKKLQLELDSRKDQSSSTDQKTFELNMRVDTMAKKLKELEKEKKEWGVQKDKVDDIEASNKRLTEENKRLRSILEDKDVDTASRMQLLERKQKDAETRVRQLEGWVGDIYVDKEKDTSGQKAIYVGNITEKPARKKVMVVESSASKTTSKKPPFSKATIGPAAAAASKPTIKVSPRRHGVRTSKSQEDVRRSPEVPSPPPSPSLPSIHEHENKRPAFGLSYRVIHQNRIKAAGRYKKW